jgi:monoamine oxidase
VRETDVVVLGAGLAGLTAARRLERAGRSVIVLEARERVGGRLMGHSVGGCTVEMGGAYLGERQDRLAALARELGVETFKTYVDGQAVYHRDNRNRRYSSAHGEVAFVAREPVGSLEYAAAVLRLQRAASRVDLEAPWRSPAAAELDTRTAQEWRDANLRSRGARFLFDQVVRGILASEPRDVSMLWLLTYIRSAGDDFWGLVRLTRVRRDLRERFVGGSHMLCERIADELEGPVVLDAAAERVEQEGGGRVRVLAAGAEYRAAELIATMPPALLGRVEWEPALPDCWAELGRRAPLGAAAKVHVVYDEPFWRADGLSGEVLSDRGPVDLVFDASPPEGRPGVLVGFVVGDAARDWARLPEAERRAEAVACFERYFGPRGGAVREYAEKVWPEDPWACGCYGTVLPRGVATEVGPGLRRRWGSVQFAGADYEFLWNGHMEGAVRGGERAAEAIVAARGARAGVAAR